MDAGSAASGSMEEAVGAGAAAWGSTGAEGVAVGAWKSGGGRRGADPARMGGQSGTGASSGNSGAACSGNWAGTPEVGMGVPAEEEGAGRSSSLVKKSSSWGDVAGGAGVENPVGAARWSERYCAKCLGERLRSPGRPRWRWRRRLREQRRR